LTTYQEFQMRLEFNADELNLAKANLAYALQKCPPEGITKTGGGSASARDVEALLKKLEAVQVKPANTLDLTGEEHALLIATTDYALTNNPVEGIMTEDDLKALKEILTAFREKLKASL